MSAQPESSFIFSITKAALAYRHKLALALEQNGFVEITPDYFIVLEVLWAENMLSIGNLAQRAFKDSASVSRMVEGMERKGLVKRAKAGTDARFSNVVLTKKGAELEKPLKELVKGFHSNSMKGLNPIETLELRRMLEHLFGNLTD